jgi:hypothetical protein
MQGMGAIQQGVRLLSVALPGLAPVLQGFFSQLVQVVPRAMAELVSGALPTGAPGAVASPSPPPEMQGDPSGAGLGAPMM